MIDSLTTFTQGIPELLAIPEANSIVFLSIFVGANLSVDCSTGGGDVLVLGGGGEITGFAFFGAFVQRLRKIL
jgi:hypothetical protein